MPPRVDRTSLPDWSWAHQVTDVELVDDQVGKGGCLPALVVAEG